MQKSIKIIAGIIFLLLLFSILLKFGQEKEIMIFVGLVSIAAFYNSLQNHYLITKGKDEA